MRLTMALGLPLIVLVVLAAEFLNLGPAFEYRRSLLLTEPWRLLTGHFVHLSLMHALLNCVALMLLGRLFADRLRAADLFALIAGAPLAISLVFWLVLPELAWYRGLSGTLHAIYFTGCVVWIARTGGRARGFPIAALVLGTVKVLLEQPWDASFPYREWLGAAVVPQAHLIGALGGAVAGLGILAARARRRRPGPGHD
ncbi:MAG: rhombosortase [Steroidobacteraceae bacterium]